uniref:Uncharacterized protein n=1 Tax=Spironucleus salmonicida TaxID=348837 RepID=V6LXN7_9EUKA|eukprot:EST49397.1 Hypothetical protein SS50377_10322 [Spironucleus salmonicida]
MFDDPEIHYLLQKAKQIRQPSNFHSNLSLKVQEQAYKQNQVLKSNQDKFDELQKVNNYQQQQIQQQNQTLQQQKISIQNLTESVVDIKSKYQLILSENDQKSQVYTECVQSLMILQVEYQNYQQSIVNLEEQRKQIQSQFSIMYQNLKSQFYKLQKNYITNKSQNNTISEQLQDQIFRNDLLEKNNDILKDENQQLHNSYIQVQYQLKETYQKIDTPLQLEDETSQIKNLNNQIIFLKQQVEDQDILRQQSMHEQNNLLQSQVIDYLQELRLQQIQIIEYTKRHENLCLFEEDYQLLQEQYQQLIIQRDELQKQLEVRGSASQEYSEGGRGSEKDSIIAGLQADVELISAEAGRMEQQLLEQTQTLDQVQIALQTAQQDNSQLAEMLQASQEQAKTAEEYKARCIVLPAEARDLYLFQQSTSNGEVSLVKLTQLSERVSHQEQLQQELALVQLDKHTLEVELAKTIAEHNQLQKQLEVRGSASQEYSEGGRGSEKDSIIAGLQADVELISAEAGRMEQQLLEQTQTLDQVQIALQTAQQDNSQLAEMLQASQEQAKTNGLKQCVTCKINLDKIQKLKIDRKELTKIIQQFQILLKENTIIKNEQLLDDVYKPGFDVNQKFSIDQFTKFLYYSKDQEKQQINYLSSSIHSSHQKYQEQKQLNIKLRTYIDLQKQQIQNQDSQLEQYNSTASLKVSFIEKPEIINSSQNINLQSQQSDLNNNFKEYNGSQIISSPILQEIQKEIQ